MTSNLNGGGAGVWTPASAACKIDLKRDEGGTKLSSSGPSSGGPKIDSIQSKSLSDLPICSPSLIVRRSILSRLRTSAIGVLIVRSSLTAGGKSNRTVVGLLCAPEGR